MNQPLSRPQRLREILGGGRPEPFLEAHSPLSAVIAEEAGFAGLWVSSLTLSCAAGVADHTLVSMSRVLDLLEGITERVSVPVLLDGDTGYGSPRHCAQLVQRLCTRSVAGVCIEDKAFPKQNSFLRPGEQRMATVEAMCDILKAGLDARTDDDFAVVARTEALITGRGLDEALDRARAYAAVGADAILIHSRQPTFDEVAAFADRWDGALPLVAVPTTYADTPRERFAAAGIAVVIWANHLLRASVTAMQEAARRIRADGGPAGLADLAPIVELFRLQGHDPGER